MTCIVGYEEDGKVYIGGDSAGVSGLDYQIREDKKVFRNGPMIFGFTGSFRMGQILQYSFTIPKQQKRDDFKYLCTDFVDKLTKCFLEKRYAKEENNEVTGGTFFLGYKGKLYRVEPDFQIAKTKTPYDSCGCGESYAMGAMYILHKNKRLSPEKKIIKALNTAESFSAGVRRPFHIVSL